MLDKNKICFITCVTSDLYYEEALLYLRQIKLPSNMSAEYISIKEAASMAAGYNEAMKKSNAKYKVYMHQDFFLTNRDAVIKILEVFNAEQAIGMIGLAGCIKVPPSGVWWQADSVGMMYHSCVPESICPIVYGDIDSDYAIVQAIDGVFMVTQYDLVWREDIFHGWHFYDISQSMEFYRAGYKVVVPKQENCWGIHATEDKKLDDHYRILQKKFLKEYTKEIL